MWTKLNENSLFPDNGYLLLTLFKSQGIIWILDPLGKSRLISGVATNQDFWKWYNMQCYC